jgi:hypothetical protein
MPTLPREVLIPRDFEMNTVQGLIATYVDRQVQRISHRDAEL